MLHNIAGILIIVTLINHSVQAHMLPSQSIIESRIKGALWGLFSGDALASPSHWYYGGFPQIQRDYGSDGITGYSKPKLHLSGSILNKSDPNGGGRLNKIHYSKGKQISIIGDVINHGKLKYWDPNQSIHYHATLQAGENTLEAQLARVLMKSITANDGRFDQDHFRKAYVDFMTAEHSHNDTYASTCHRMFFANLIFNKRDPRDCPDNDGHNVDTVDGLVLPTITALAETARQFALSRSDDDNSRGVMDGEEARKAIESAAAKTAAVTRSSNLLGNVSAVWADLVRSTLMMPDDGGLDSSTDHTSGMERALAQTAERLGIRHPRPRGQDQMTACYLTQSLPPTLDMISKYTQPSNTASSLCWRALIANANVGGENVHRGAILGAILGAYVGDEQLPKEMKEGLYEKKVIEKEIDDFVRAVMKSGTSSKERSAMSKQCSEESA